MGELEKNERWPKGTWPSKGEKVQSQKNHSIVAEKENKIEECLTFHCENVKGTTCERYSRGKYQDERMRMKARKVLEGWEEKVKKAKEWDRKTASTKADDVRGDAERGFVFVWLTRRS